MKSKIQSFFTFLLLLGFVALCVSLIAWVINGGLNEFTVTYNDTTYTQSTENISIVQSGTFTVNYKDKDTDDIKVKLTAVELYEDFYFQSEGKTYSWNVNVARSKIGNFTECVDITIDNVNNTVTVKGSITEALKKAGNTDDIMLLSTLPNEDMFNLEITSGNTTINIGCRIQSPVSQIVLQDNLQIRV